MTPRGVSVNFRQATRSHNSRRGYATESTSPIRLLLLGAPGAGKGTHAGNLIKRYNFDMVVAGDFLRDQVNRKTKLGGEMSAVMKSGRLLSDDLIWRIIRPALEKRSNTNCILDGFPRTKEQASMLDDFLGQSNQRLDLIINLNVPDEVILERIEGRWIHAPSQRQYNTTFNPPKIPGKDDITGEPLTKRVDDDAATFKIRLEEYHAKTRPLIEHYETAGQSDRLVTVTGPTSKIVWPQIEKLIDTRFPQIKR